MPARHDFGIETEKNPEVWADKVRAAYDHQISEERDLITLPDHLLWSMPAVDEAPLLASRGIRFAICEERDGCIATFIDPIPDPDENS